MRRFTRVAGCVVVLVAAGTTVATADEGEAAATCNGRTVTISWQDLPVGTTTINGTTGPDVIQGGPRGERINGGGGEDVVCGGDGQDLVDGGRGRDELFGQDGSDTFVGPDLAQDLVNGGSQDLDSVNYAATGAAVEVNMNNGLVHATGAPLNGGILGIEVVSGSSFADQLTGGSGADRLYGRGGDDLLDGRGKSDLLTGGSGIDRVTYANASSTVSVKMSVEQSTAKVGTDLDLLDGLEIVIGTPFDDRMVGDSTDDTFVGGGGDDVLKGEGGDDILEGGGGDDTLFPGPGDDQVDGGANTPVTSSGAHGDLVSYHGETLPAGVTHLEVALYYFAPTNNPPYASGIGEDDLSGVESVRGVKNGKNHLYGDDGPNVLIGGDGQDFLEGRGGNDLVYGLGGVDILNGDYAAGVSPNIFGDDYLDGGGPTGPSDGDRVHGNGGTDTCTGAVDDNDHLTECETTF